MLARQFSMSYGQRPMLLLRTKTVLVDGKPVKVYSFDGRTWFSKGRDRTEFNRRRPNREKQHSKRACSFVTNRLT
jgi:hypothetical protein